MFRIQTTGFSHGSKGIVGARLHAAHEVSTQMISLRLLIQTFVKMFSLLTYIYCVTRPAWAFDLLGFRIPNTSLNVLIG
jgi:hypothetical protein